MAYSLEIEEGRNQHRFPMGTTLRFYAFVAIFTGALRLLSIPLVGQMPISELILLLLVGHAFLTIILHHRFPATFPRLRFLNLLVACQVIALLSYVVSDFARGSSSVDMIRGWLRMIFLLIDVGALALLFGANSYNFILVQIGTCFSGFQALFVRPIFGDYWKFGYGTPVTVFLLLLIPRFFGYWASIAACFGLGCLHIAMDFRSMAATCFILGIMQLFCVLRPAIRKTLVLSLAVFFLLGLPWLAQRVLGVTEGRAERSNVERSAMLQAAWEAFQESPLIGHGSWFSNSSVMDNFLTIRKQNSTLSGGGGMGFDHTDYQGITIHSQILTSLAEGGFFGGLFFMVYSLMIAWCLWYLICIAPWIWHTSIRVFVLICSLFDVVMTPFSGVIRLNIAIAAALCLVVLEEARQRKLAQANSDQGLRGEFNSGLGGLQST